MTTVKVKWVHECEKPQIPKETWTSVSYRRNWYGKKVEVVHEHSEFKYNTVEWTCPTCESKWEFSAWGDEGFWMCRSRPDVWKDVEL